MLTTADLALLNEAYRNTKMGLEAINTVISQCEMWVDNPMEAASYPEHDTKIYEYAVSGQNAKVADESSPYA